MVFGFYFFILLVLLLVGLGYFPGWLDENTNIKYVFLILNKNRIR